MKEMKNIDVVALLSDMYEYFPEIGCRQEDFEEAKNAVAGLIEADEHLDKILARSYKFPCQGMDDHVKMALERRDWCIKRVKGEVW